MHASGELAWICLERLRRLLGLLTASANGHYDLCHDACARDQKVDGYRSLFALSDVCVVLYSSDLSTAFHPNRCSAPRLGAVSGPGLSLLISSLAYHRILGTHTVSARCRYVPADSKYCISESAAKKC